MTDKSMVAIRRGGSYSWAGIIGTILTISTLLMLLGVWYYTTKNLPDRVVCLEKTSDIHGLTIARHENEIVKVSQKHDADNLKLAEKLDKILDQQSRMMMTLGELRGKSRTGNEQ